MAGVDKHKDEWRKGQLIGSSDHILFPSVVTLLRHSSASLPTTLPLDFAKLENKHSLVHGSDYLTHRGLKVIRDVVKWWLVINDTAAHTSRYQSSLGHYAL